MSMTSSSATSSFYSSSSYSSMASSTTAAAATETSPTFGEPDFKGLQSGAAAGGRISCAAAMIAMFGVGIVVGW